MSVIKMLASSLGRRDEVPNQELAQEIATNNDVAGVNELMEGLQHKSKDVQNDCIKTLYEIGALRPSLIAEYSAVFLKLLRHKNNRLQWGGMTALNTIVTEKPKVIYAALPEIVAAANSGSVITKDNAVRILVSLCSTKAYAKNAFSLLNEQLLHSPTNQLPMYAEAAAPIIDDENRKVFLRTLSSRLREIEQDPKRKRIEKVIKKLSR